MVEIKKSIKHLRDRWSEATDEWSQLSVVKAFREDTG